MSILLIPIATLLTAVGAGGEPSAPRNDSIRQQDMKADLFFLAGDGFRGRLTGTAENRLACEFIASRFARLGLKPVGSGGSYYQHFQLSTATLGPSNSLKAIYPNGAFTLQSHAGQELIPMYFCPSGERQVQGAPTFVGFGISDPERGHDDYRNTDVAARIVLVLDHEPGENDPKSPFDGVVMSEASSRAAEGAAAQEKGAVRHPLCIGRAQPSGTARTSRRWRNRHGRRGRREFQAIPCRSGSIESTSRRPRSPLRWQVPCCTPSRTARSKIWRRASEKPCDERLVNIGSPRSTLSTDVRHHVVPDRNVLAALEGSDPEAQGRVGDHLVPSRPQRRRRQSRSSTAPTTTARAPWACSRSPRRTPWPRRTVIGPSGRFSSPRSTPRSAGCSARGRSSSGRRCLWNGSSPCSTWTWSAATRKFPKGAVRASGACRCSRPSRTSNAVNLLGHSRSSSLAQTIDHANAAFGLTLKKVLDNNSSNLLRRSDQWPFLQRGVPAVFFHTGLHPDYHTSADRPEKINYAKMERIVRLVHQASWDLRSKAAGRGWIKGHRYHE